jgi:hypothetical protein
MLARWKKSWLSSRGSSNMRKGTLCFIFDTFLTLQKLMGIQDLCMRGNIQKPFRKMYSSAFHEERIWAPYSHTAWWHELGNNITVLLRNQPCSPIGAGKIWIIFVRSDYSNISWWILNTFFQFFSETFGCGAGADNSSFSARNRMDFVEC